MIYYSHSEAETMALAARLTTQISGGQICLFGEMGTGKTVFVRGFLKAMGYTGEVTSPTFALCHRYSTSKTVLHYDLYRLNGYDDLYSIGFFDEPEDTIQLIEWSENAEDYLAPNHISVYFSYGKQPKERVLRLEGVTL